MRPSRFACARRAHARDIRLGAGTLGCGLRISWRVRFLPIGAPFYRQAFLIVLAIRVIVARHTQKPRFQFSLVYGFFNAPDIRPNREGKGEGDSDAE